MVNEQCLLVHFEAGAFIEERIYFFINYTEALKLTACLPVMFLVPYLELQGKF
jgi:hypothetical protein